MIISVNRSYMTAYSRISLSSEVKYVNFKRRTHFFSNMAVDPAGALSAKVFLQTAYAQNNEYRDHAFVSALSRSNLYRSRRVFIKSLHVCTILRMSTITLSILILCMN